MTKPIVIDMADILHNANVGVKGATSGWGIFIGSEPDTPVKTITLYDAPGDAPNPKYLLDFPRFVVRVRSNSYEEAYVKAEEIKSTLLGLPSQDIDGIRYVGIYGVIDTYYLQADAKGRKIFVNTWRAIREPITGVNRIPL